MRTHEQADLIVVGSRGLTGIKRYLLGSVSNKVSEHAHCSVMIIPPTETPSYVGGCRPRPERPRGVHIVPASQVRKRVSRIVRLLMRTVADAGERSLSLIVVMTVRINRNRAAAGETL